MPLKLYWQDVKEDKFMVKKYEEAGRPPVQQYIF